MALAGGVEADLSFPKAGVPTETLPEEPCPTALAVTYAVGVFHKMVF